MLGIRKFVQFFFSLAEVYFEAGDQLPNEEYHKVNHEDLLSSPQYAESCPTSCKLQVAIVVCCCLQNTHVFLEM